MSRRYGRRGYGRRHKAAGSFGCLFYLFVCLLFYFLVR